MALDARIRELGVRHRSLDEAIQKELARPGPDTDRVQDLKRRKLRLKEEIAGLSARI